MTATDQRVRWGVISTANIGRAAVNAAIQASSNGELLAVASRAGERATAFAAEHGIPRAYGSYEALLDDDEIDAVYVPLPNSMHRDWTIRAAEAGKHVLCEKPIAISLADADRAIDTCRQAGVAFMVGHVLRFWHEYEFLKGATAEGMFGHPHSLTCSRLVKAPDWTAGNWLLDPAQSLGAAGEVMIHDLDVVCWLLGRPCSVSASGRRDGGGWSHMQALLRYEAGAPVLATVEAGWDAPDEEPFTAQFRAVFDEAIVEYDSRRESTLAVSGRPAPSVRQAEKTQGGPWSFDAAPYFAEVDYFAARIRDGSLPDRCPPEDARQALEFVLAVIESASSGHEVPLT